MSDVIKVVFDRSESDPMDWEIQEIKQRLEPIREWAGNHYPENALAYAFFQVLTEAIQDNGEDDNFAAFLVEALHESLGDRLAAYREPGGE